MPDLTINAPKRLNEKIKSDIDKFVDAKSREKIETLKQDLALWMVALSIVENGSFSKGEQRQFSEMFDNDTLGKLKSFLSPFFDSNLFNLKFLLAFTKIMILKYFINLLSISKGIS